MALGAAGVGLAGVLAASGATAGATPGRSPGHAAGASAASYVTRTAPDGLPPYPVVFIGDSVTAGFGYCGAEEAEKDVSCGVNQEMANSWYRGDNSLKDCAPPDPPKLPNDACSNNNVRRRPWEAFYWQDRPGSPRIAYPYQIAARQDQDLHTAAPVEDWAITGSTPANWDPNGGAYAPELRKINGQYVVMTLGANPLLSAYTNITFPIPFVSNVSGPCVASTGYSVGWFSPDWYAGKLSDTVGCLDRQWKKIHQTDHLLAIYKALLTQNDHVLVLGYYRDCPWSFGNWQPAASLTGGPAQGNSCQSQKRPVSQQDPTVITQWEQAVAVGNSLNEHIHKVVTEAQDWAKQEWPGTDRFKDIAWTAPDQAAWAAHQPHSPEGSWIFLNDTWIHPSRTGATQLANTVIKAMCADFRHWCGNPPLWG